MKTNQTTTIETRYLRTLLEVNAQEAGMIVQRFARLALGEDAKPTGDRFLDYIGAVEVPQDLKPQEDKTK